MDTSKDRLRLEPTEEWLAVEYDLPRATTDEDADVQAAAERERYDEQIYAALVAPTFQGLGAVTPGRAPAPAPAAGRGARAPAVRTASRAPPCP